MVDYVSDPRFATVVLSTRDQPASTAGPDPAWTVLLGPEMPGYPAVIGNKYLQLVSLLLTSRYDTRECTATCLPSFQFPGGGTQVKISCDDGDWRPDTGDTVLDCQGQFAN